MATTLDHYYRYFAVNREQIEEYVKAKYDISSTELARRIRDLAIEVDVKEHWLILGDSLPVFVWQLIVILLRIGCEMSLLRRLMRYAAGVDFARAALYEGASSLPDDLDLFCALTSQPVATLLHFASTVEAATKFLLVGDIDARDHCGFTPLHRAALRGKSDVVELLLENGAAWSVQSNRRRTAMHAAVRGGDKRTINLLLDFGATWMVPGLIHCALSSSAPLVDIELMCRRIVRASSDNIVGIDDFGRTALERAVACGEPMAGIVRLLLTAVLNRTRDNLARGMCAAIEYGNDAALAELIAFCPRALDGRAAGDQRARGRSRLRRR
jgi:hypothetical protein